MKKCSKTGHQEINATIFCSGCKIYMCNKWEKSHSDLFENLNGTKIIKDINNGDMFSGIREDGNHTKKLMFFC